MSKAIRHITADTKALIHELVNLLYEFLPLTSNSKNAVTFISIFKESKVHRYLNRGGHKKARLQNGFENLIRYHKNLPYTVIRKTVPAAIEYRRYKRNPLTRDEIASLIDTLEALDINMRIELSKIELDENIPEIQVPPAELVSRLENHPLADEILSEPLDLFKNGHFNEAVRKTTERFEVIVKEITGLNDFGKQLMSRSFSMPTPKIKLNNLLSENERGFQEGYQHLAMGMTQSIRNIFSHGDENQRSPEEAYEMLMFLNWLFRILNNAIAE